MIRRFRVQSAALAVVGALVACTTPAIEDTSNRGGIAPAGPQPLLEEPPVLANRNTTDPQHVMEVQVTAAQEPLQVVPGPKTTAMLYGDGAPGDPLHPPVFSFPGPALVATEGMKVIFHFHNRLGFTNLPARTSLFSNVHFHGMIIPPEQDGSPINQVPDGEDHTYVWTAAEGFPMTTWYHAHPHGLTHVEVARGLEAPLRVLAQHDPLPASYGSTTIFLGDVFLDANNQFDPDTEKQRIEGREGNVLLVNGQRFPKLYLRRGEIRRLRMGDFSVAHFFNLSLPGISMLQVGTDGGLFAHAVHVDPLLLGDAERAEVLIQMPKDAAPGTAYTLLDLPYDRGFGKAKAPVPLMTFVASDSPPVNADPIPDPIRIVEPISQAGAAVRSFRVGDPSLGGGVHHFGLNGLQFDPIRIDNVGTYGTTEIYDINNHQGNWDHPMHLHSTQFQVLDVDGVPPVTGPAWKDTVNIPRSKEGRFIVRYNQFQGLFFFHCHILSHENDGLMTTVEVDPGASYQRPPGNADALLGATHATH